VISDADYPLESLLANESGTVSLNLLIDRSGRVYFAQTLKGSGFTRLDQAAIEIAKTKWRFQPSQKEGQPTDGAVKVDVTWTLPLIPVNEFAIDAPNPPAGAKLVAPEPLTRNTVTARDYPEASIRLSEQGRTWVQYQITDKGMVGETRVVEPSGHPRLDEAATRVVRRWKFTPGTVDGKPSDFWVAAFVFFTLDKGGRDFCAARPLISPYERRLRMKDGKLFGGEGWLLVNDQRTVIDALLQTNMGWMRVSKVLADQIKVPPEFVFEEKRTNKTNCWINVPLPP
jgi:protein TonB